MAKSWQEKYNTIVEPKTKVITKRFADLQEGTKMFIATPAIINNYLKEVPEGVFVDLKTMRKDIALDNLADNTCPVTTSIFLRIVAEVALQELEQTKNIEEITPFWRAIDIKKPIAQKISCGVSFIKYQQKKEGII